MKRPKYIEITFNFNVADNIEYWLSEDQVDYDKILEDFIDMQMGVQGALINKRKLYQEFALDSEDNKEIAMVEIKWRSE